MTTRLKEYTDFCYDIFHSTLHHDIFTKEVEGRNGLTYEALGVTYLYNFENEFEVLAMPFRKLYLKQVIGEFVSFFNGTVSAEELEANGCTYWQPWYNDELKGRLGPIYGAQWRNFNGVDQIANIIKRLRARDQSRQLILTSWNPVELDSMALPPCYPMIQFLQRDDQLNMIVSQRSLDMIIGLPYDLVIYSLLMHTMCWFSGLFPGQMILNVGSAHVYDKNSEVFNNYYNTLEEPLSLTTFVRDIDRIPLLSLSSSFPEDPMECDTFFVMPSDYDITNYEPFLDGPKLEVQK